MISCTILTADRPSADVRLHISSDKTATMENTLHFVMDDGKLEQPPVVQVTVPRPGYPPLSGKQHAVKLQYIHTEGEDPIWIGNISIPTTVRSVIYEFLGMKDEGPNLIFVDGSYIVRRFSKGSHKLTAIGPRTSSAPIGIPRSNIRRKNVSNTNSASSTEDYDVASLDNLDVSSLNGVDTLSLDGLVAANLHGFDVASLDDSDTGNVHDCVDTDLKNDHSSLNNVQGRVDTGLQTAADPSSQQANGHEQYSLFASELQKNTSKLSNGRGCSDTGLQRDTSGIINVEDCVDSSLQLQADTSGMSSVKDCVGTLVQTDISGISNEKDDIDTRLQYDTSSLDDVWVKLYVETRYGNEQMIEQTPVVKSKHDNTQQSSDLHWQHDLHCSKSTSTARKLETPNVEKSNSLRSFCKGIKRRFSSKRQK